MWIFKCLTAKNFIYMYKEIKKTKMCSQYDDTFWEWLSTTSCMEDVGVSSVYHNEMSVGIMLHQCAWQLLCGLPRSFWLCYLSPVGLHHEQLSLSAVHPCGIMCNILAVLCAAAEPSSEPVWLIVMSPEVSQNWVCVPYDQLLLTHWLISLLFLGIEA